MEKRRNVLMMFSSKPGSIIKSNHQKGQKNSKKVNTTRRKYNGVADPKEDNCEPYANSFRRLTTQVTAKIYFLQDDDKENKKLDEKGKENEDLMRKSLQ